MKTANINRLSRIIEHYKAICDLFDVIIDKTDYDEYIEHGGTNLRLYNLLREAEQDAIAQGLWLERTLKVIKENNKNDNNEK